MGHHLLLTATLLSLKRSQETLKSGSIGKRMVTYHFYHEVKYWKKTKVLF